MPFLRIEMLRGRGKQTIQELSRHIQRAVALAFAVPADACYQVITEHDPEHFLAGNGPDQGGCDDAILIQVFTSPRPRTQKKILYRLIIESLEQHCHIDGGNIFVSFTVNSDEDWSYRHRRTARTLAR